MFSGVFKCSVNSRFAFVDQINESFLDFIIESIETASDDDKGEQLVETFVPLILSFNQHFIGKDISCT